MDTLAHAELVQSLTLVVACTFLAAVQVHASVGAFRRASRLRRSPRISPREVRGFVTFQVVFAALLVYMWSTGDWDLADLGVSTTVHPLAAYFLGILAYFGYNFLWGATAYLLVV